MPYIKGGAGARGQKSGMKEQSNALATRYSALAAENKILKSERAQLEKVVASLQARNIKDREAHEQSSIRLKKKLTEVERQLAVLSRPSSRQAKELVRETAIGKLKEEVEILRRKKVELKLAVGELAGIAARHEVEEACSWILAEATEPGMPKAAREFLAREGEYLARHKDWEAGKRVLGELLRAYCFLVRQAKS
jgi:chromosome segregation ATPase